MNLTPPPSSQNSHAVRWHQNQNRESHWNKKLISLSSPDWSASLRPSLEWKMRPWDEKCFKKTAKNRSFSVKRSGSKFHVDRLVTANGRPPCMTRQCCRTVSWWLAAEWRCCLDAVSKSGSNYCDGDSTALHDRLLHPHLRHCSSPASVVRRLPSAVRTATPAFHVQSSGLFCSRPGGLQLVTRLPARSVTFLC